MKLSIFVSFLFIPYLCQAIQLFPGRKEIPKDNAPQASTVYLPQEFHSVFVFMDENILKPPGQNASLAEITEFLQNSIPFHFKSFFQMEDLVIIQPTGSSNSYEMVPFMVALFSKKNPPSPPPQSPDKEQQVNSFWDGFMKDWIQADLLNVLLHSTFCTFDATAFNNPGYCISITKENSIEFFEVPLEALATDIFSELSITNLVKQDTRAKSASTEFKIQVVDPSTLGLPLLRNHTRKLTTSALTTSLNNKYGTSTTNGSNNLESKFFKKKLQELLVNGLLKSEKKINVQSIKFDHLVQAAANPRSSNYTQVLVPSEKVLAKLGQKINGKFIKREELRQIMQANEKEAREESCAEVTWHNVFLNSVFGKPHLCKIDEEK